MKIVGLTLGNCIHVAGILSFLGVAEAMGYSIKFKGTRTSNEKIPQIIREENPDILALSYRLTPEVAGNIFADLKERLMRENLSPRMIFGGTVSVCKVARKSGMFEEVFDGFSTIEDVMAYLSGRKKGKRKAYYPKTLIERLQAKSPYPLLRAHFGLPSLKETVKGIVRIAQAKALDIISIGPDQITQEYFFRQHLAEKMQEGAGGVPLRTEEDFISLHKAAQRGNHPLIRCYSGTNDLIRMTEMMQRTIKNAWCAVPLCWYSVLDGRSSRPVKKAIQENQECMRWHGERGIPLEVNESHHWSLRDGHDAVAVAMAYIAAFNAKRMGVQHYIAQYMLNTPLKTSPSADYAKMSAKIELIESLHDETFTSLRQTRAGLMSFPANLEAAKGQLASSAYTAMALQPDIYHIVSFCEADHAATAKDIIASSHIARRVILNCLLGMPDFSVDPYVRERKATLLREAKVILAAIELLGDGSEDALCNPTILEEAIRIGILDAPHLEGNLAASGKVRTRMVDGGCFAIDSESGEVLSEEERLAMLGFKLREIAGV